MSEYTGRSAQFMIERLHIDIMNLVKDREFLRSRFDEVLSALDSMQTREKLGRLDALAGMAMQAMLSNPSFFESPNTGLSFVDLAVQLANALIAELDK